ncbi:galactosylgalactosylxylosyl 3-beta-glucuronosyltransferase 2 isoform X1 [Pelobates cultripes]|uniref:Galactosylgalactosylxylosylprotein 3-beta-glucuronosyltransferase n=1 Tax=Pelobates cultripes TaxID=61616 RepID=A0AAD1VUJ4_PELCU|nr:galactosylgalactosylxylosyl 3-beta-glucuronosyltransferase 2 isoform X1 [Pelobates cultripes]
MKSALYSRFFILLPWVLIVVIIIDSDTRKPSSSSRLPSARHYSPYWNRRVGRSALMRPQPSDTSVGTWATHQEQVSIPGVQKMKNDTLPIIYAITPTYSRPVQKAELTRLANTFRQVAGLHWIVVEDSPQPTELVNRFLARAGVRATHLHVPTPRRYKRAGLPRATEQRNAGLTWLRQQYQTQLLHRQTTAPGSSPHLPNISGVVFFADDDNTYSLELFQEMRTTQKVSVWPVGLVGGRRYERPVVENGKVVGWYTGWRADRPFAIDMAGFAVSLQVILSSPKALFKRRGSQPGMQESDFLKQITKVDELEPKASNCTKVTTRMQYLNFFF